MGQRVIKIVAAALGLVLATPMLAQAQSTLFQRVLDQPDDISITLAYFQELVAQGRLDAAAAALERALLINPDADSLRLAYALVLYRLGDLAGSNREIAILEEKPLPPDLAAELARRKSEIANASSDIRMSLLVAAGARVDSNRAGQASSSTGLFLGNIVPIDGKARPDVAGLASLSFAIEKDLDAARSLTAFAFADLGVAQQARLTEYSVQAGALEVGLAWRSAPVGLRVSALGRAFRLDNQNFGLEYGGRAEATFDLSERFQLFADFEGVEQRFRPISISDAADLRNGPRIRTGLGATVLVTDRLSVNVAGRGLFKTAEVDWYDYRGGEASLFATALFDGGQYVRLDASAARVVYGAPDPVYSPTLTRTDNTYRARLTYGVPLATIGQWTGSTLPAPLSQVTLQLAADVTWQRSNIPDFTFNNVGGEAILMRRLTF